MSENLNKLKAILREMFQLDQADLDFGIYRIMNQKRDEIEQFLDRDLLPQVKTVFAGFQGDDQSSVRDEMDKLKKTLEDAGVVAETSPKYQALQAKLSSSVDVSALENEVFSQLTNFFRRYYNGGDFLSLRRYKAGVYAIPYEGEEVKLHWANADQYYIKSSENFRDYTFKLPSGKRAHFKLVDASTEQNNKKEQSGKERRFILVDDSPLVVDNGELFIRFEYRVADENSKQATLNEAAVQTIFASFPPPLTGGGQGVGEVGSIDAVGTVTPTLTLPRQGGGDDFVDWKRELSALAPTEKNTKRTLLEKHLNDYTAKYSFDYFIHKDLGGFMRRELDFFIKNEILFIDDLDADHVKATISKVKVIKEIGHKVITFLEQLENFQKKLWLKKKFVVDTGYCSTLDKVPEFLLPAISENYEQICEWIKLGFIEESEVEGLKKWLEEEKSEGGRVKGETDLFGNPVSTSFTPHSSPFTFLVLDTVFFNQEFSEKLLASFDNLDEATDGLLVHSENFQALNLLLERFQGQIKCTYIDPPYNTDGDDFIYKDSYQHSSWLSMMNDRLVLGRRGLPIDGVFITSIGREELFRLEQLCSSIFGEENRVGDLIWEKGRKNDAKFFSLGHDYFLVYVKSKEHLTSTGTIWREEKPGAAEILAEYRKLKHQFGTDYSAIQEGIRKFYTSLPKAHLSLKHRRYNRVDKNGIWRDDNISWPGGNGPRYDVIHPETNLPCKVPERGWAFAAIEKFKLYEQHGFIEYREDHNDPPMLKRYLNYVSTDFDPDARRRNISDSGEEEEANVQVMPSVIYKNQQPTVVELRNILGGEGFKNPKDPSVLARLFSYVSNRNDVILDFFAGSGTSGHAVISQNREDNGNRKYILVEMGEHFDAVLKPRIQKVIYSKDWKDGKPVSRQGSSHLFKYIRLESYEDALNNLQLKRTHEQGSLLEQHDMLREQYMLSYMLDVESAGSTSLLNIAAFADPFGYRMNIARGNETKETVVDLVETFNWLLGIKVLRISQKEYRAAEFEADAEGRLQIAGRARTCGTGEGWTFQEVEGQTLSGDKVLVIWRTLTDKQEQDNLMLDTWFGKRNYNTLDFEFSRIYVNGDNNLENLKIGEERWKVALIEQEFKKLMFEMQE